MSIKIVYVGGPRAGNKNTLQDVDHAEHLPNVIRCEAEAKKRRMQGRYIRDHSSSKEPYKYEWERAKVCPLSKLDPSGVEQPTQQPSYR